MRKIIVLLIAAFAVSSPIQVFAADFLPQYTASAFTPEESWWYISTGDTVVEASDRALIKCLEAASGCQRGPVVEGGAIFASLTCPSYGKTIVALKQKGQLSIDLSVLDVVSEREFYTECRVDAENFGGTIEQWMQIADPFRFD